MLTNERVENLRSCVDYSRNLEGNEKGEAQVYCDRLFRAFGHKEDPFTSLLALNAELIDREAGGRDRLLVVLPPSIVSTQRLVSEDHITVVQAPRPSR